MRENSRAAGELLERCEWSPGQILMVAMCGFVQCTLSMQNAVLRLVDSREECNNCSTTLQLKIKEV